jgi:NADH:ubiquinone oxidoreductase subunit E
MEVRSPATKATRKPWDDVPRGPESIIVLLQSIQEEEGYVSEEGIARVAEHARSAASAVYGVATFYSQFRLRRPGLHTLRVCEGTACHVLGSEDVMESLKELLGVDVGGTTSDGLFTLESVRCLGCCSLAPAMMVDNETYGRVGRKQIATILQKYRVDTR